MADLGWIEIPSWERFQTYDTARNSTGRPPWIKIYTSLMSDDRYLDLTGDQRAILHGLWLEYASSTPRARAEHAPTSPRLRADTRSLTRRLNLRVTSAQLKRLEHDGYIVIIARIENADGTQAALASRVGEEERREEKTSSQVGVVASSDAGPDSQATRPDSTVSNKQAQAVEAWLKPESKPLNGATADGDGLQPIDVDAELERWTRRTA